MAYALKYRSEFSSIKNTQYRFDIEQKDYSGSFYSLQCAGKPIVHRWQTDEPKPTIKGSAVTFNYLNKGTQPLNIFYSEEDDTFKGILTCITTGETLFVGFLVQDDCNEVELPFTHEVSLSFNDNLGLLKDLLLNVAFDGYIIPNLLNGKQSLATILFACLQATNIQLPVNIFSNLYEYDVENKQYSTFNTTLIDTDTFLVNETTYDNCYSVLEKILKTFECTLLQSSGQWNVVRWGELRQYGNAIAGWQWDKDFIALGTVALNTLTTFGTNGTSLVETGLTKRIQRPFKYAKETFNYRNPSQLLKNGKGTILGALISTVTSGGNTISEYQLPNWFNGDFAPFPARSIQITKNSLGVEIGRYIVLRGATGDSARSAKSTSIEVSKGDRITLNFKFRTLSSFPPPGNIFFRIALSTSLSVAIKYAKNDGTWVPTTGAWQYGVTTDLINWQTVSIETGAIPADGLLNIFLGEFVNAGTMYSDLSLSIVYSINESLNVIAQTHTDTQDGTIKNKEDIAIEVDDSPRNSIAGTLFLSAFTGLLYTRTQRWQHVLGGNILQLGRYITFDKLFQRRIVRTILEGNLYGILQANNKCISALSVLKSEDYTALNFVAGNLEIDYRNDDAKGTFHELHSDGESVFDLTENYNFAYLYENK